MGSLSYTVGNWTVASRETDTISTPKTLSIPDIDFAHDYSVEPASTTRAARLLNVAGGSLDPVETIGYRRDKYDDIYKGANIDIPSISQLPSRDGIKVQAELISYVTAVNSVTGAEIVIPFRTWISTVASIHNAVTADAVLWHLKRCASTLFDTGAVTSTGIAKLFRGDLDPTK